jgi:hypothetical protein
VIRVVVWLLLLAAVLYAVFWVIDRRNRFGGGPGGRFSRGGGPRSPKTPPTAPRGPVGPDDDEAFLRDLERRRRREQGDQPPG